MMDRDSLRQAVLIREELHKIPEIAGKEVKTAAVIRRELAEIPSIRVLEPFLQTDTVAFIDGKSPGKCDFAGRYRCSCFK